MFKKPTTVNRMSQPEDFKNAFVVGTANVQSDGKLKWKIVAIFPNAGSLRQHGNILVVAGPGGGKGRIITVNLISWGHSAIVIDLKGETYTKTANARYKVDNGKGKVVVLDSKNGTGHRYNPLSVVSRDQWFDLAAELISVTNGDPFWSSVANDLWLAAWSAAQHARRPHMPYAVELMKLDLSDAICYFMYYHKDDPATMQHLLDFLGTRPNEEQMAKIKGGNASRLLESMWKTVKTTMTIFNDTILLNLMSGHDVDVEGMFYNGGITTIYVIVDETKPRVFAAFGRLIMKTLGDALIREGDKQNVVRRPILMLFDEFGRVRLNDVFDWLDTLRSRDIVLCIFLQKLSQFAPKNGKEFDESDENSFHHWILFAPNNPSGRIGKLISGMSGQTTVRADGGVGRSVNMDGDITTSRNVSFARRAVVEQEDYETWGADQAYVTLRQLRTEKYVVTSANTDNLGWALPPEAQPLPRLSSYVSPLMPLPSEIDAATWTAAQQIVEEAGGDDAVSNAMRAALGGLGMAVTV
ncbi:hypothetical protein FNU79_17765 [Deinococcus detaillensis]|uniref:Type IV secretory system conjugative DNA transfer family protein n=1 Tax=Deinococcus detaillensis TaxID=2592048 RepID=A0A553UH53_9DEIO|nr:type IV secretory system conjugative DNA transfer family protein [Deinococcus detaillensis]TSA79538.1 hypothetical protein FNU79_17765 [Deinococcus detaillensis]